MLVGGYRLFCRGRLLGAWELRPPRMDPDLPNNFSPMLETVLDRLWPLFGGSCRGVGLNADGSC
jgi:hypothetical protein